MHDVVDVLGGAVRAHGDYVAGAEGVGWVVDEEMLGGAVVLEAWLARARTFTGKTCVGVTNLPEVLVPCLSRNLDFDSLVHQAGAHDHGGWVAYRFSILVFRVIPRCGLFSLRERSIKMGCDRICCDGSW